MQKRLSVLFLTWTIETLVLKFLESTVGIYLCECACYAFKNKLNYNAVQKHDYLTRHIHHLTAPHILYLLIFRDLSYGDQFSFYAFCSSMVLK